LANASTPGYKADRTAQRSFGELMLANRQNGNAVGAVGLGAQVDTIRVDMTQGAIRDTGEPLDLALAGTGFLSVRTEEGVMYTRGGQLALSADRTLQTSTGLPVLDTAGNPIRLPDGEPTISRDGTITVGGNRVAQLAIVALENPVKQGESLFTGRLVGQSQDTTVQQRALEASAVAPASAMVEMMVSMRAFESAQRIIRTIDETLQRGIQGGGAS
jgi:flagellar basal-body rod protein FlgG